MMRTNCQKQRDMKIIQLYNCSNSSNFPLVASLWTGFVGISEDAFSGAMNCLSAILLGFRVTSPKNLKNYNYEKKHTSKSVGVDLARSNQL